MKPLEHTLTDNRSNLSKGTIYLANESRFDTVNYSEALTHFTVGWSDQERLVDMLEFIAPSVPVGRRFEFKKMDNAEVFYSETDDVRSIGSDFKRIEYAGSSVHEKTLNKGLTIRVDHDEIMGDDWQERYVQLLLQRLYRNELKRAVQALSEVAISKPCTWSDTEAAGANPDTNLRDMLRSASERSGIRPNRILFGEEAWDLRINAYEMLTTAGAFRSAHLNTQELSQKLLAEDVRVLRSYFQMHTTAKESLAKNEVYAFYGQSILTKDDPSNLKRFVTPVDGNTFRVYVEEHSKYTDITVEHYSNLIVTSNLGIQKLVIS